MHSMRVIRGAQHALHACDRLGDVVTFPLLLTFSPITRSMHSMRVIGLVTVGHPDRAVRS